MARTDDEPEVRNLILYGVIALCVAKEVASFWAVIG